MRISVVVPIYNEQGNIVPLCQAVATALTAYDYELILVDDGSTDGSIETIRQAVAEQPSKWKAIFLSRNFGQTAAIAAGINAATGSVIIPMDGDLENDPADIPRLLAKLDDGFDVVSGWRQNRWANQKFTRKWPSVIANDLISWATGLSLHDYGCTLKAYRSEVLKDIRFYGDMHRFIPAYASWQGARVAELPVSYKPRTYGVSKYGLNRIRRVILDLLMLKFMADYAARPLHLFGNVGLITIGVGFLSGLLAIYYKLSVANHKDFIETPLPVVTAMMVVVGVAFIMMGLLAEIMIRTYHESQGKVIYRIREKVNLS